MFASDREGFIEKNQTGVMAKYCQRCNQHLDLHGHKRLIGGGTVRSCPVEALAAVDERRKVTQETPARQLESPEVWQTPLHTSPPPPMATPYGTDYTSHNESYIRSKKCAEPTVQTHLGGSSCAVVAGEFLPEPHLPVHIAGRNALKPNGHLSGAAAVSQFDELEVLNAKAHHSQSRALGLHGSSMSGGGLIPK